jgi:hypothetical protein
MLHLIHSPYDLTLQIDADRTICGDISPVFDYLQPLPKEASLSSSSNMKNGEGHEYQDTDHYDYDVLQVSVGILPSFDNGVIAYRKGRK